ncbi:hypothetical protein EV401DRAFT_1916643 [Pisolithus croceorrhizus]|nr:hypothetical protein EV401DRAFT_1916643 [Pisolithus croceorrhizus]
MCMHLPEIQALRVGSRCSLVVDPSIDISQLAIVALSGRHCLRSLSLDPTVATDTDDGLIAQAHLAWPNIEDLSLRGWRRSDSHPVTLEGVRELLRSCLRLSSLIAQVDTRTLPGQGPEVQSSSPKKLHIFASLVIGALVTSIGYTVATEAVQTDPLCNTALRLETTNTAITTGSRHSRTRSLRTAEINAVIRVFPESTTYLATPSSS